jgi:hypothetical protein
MKIFLYSIFMAFVFLSLYMTILYVLLKTESINALTVANLAYPLKIPQFIYYFIFPINYMNLQNVSKNERFITGLGYLVFNILIYSIPINLVLRRIFQKRKIAEKIFVPPPPPSFE